MNDYLNKYDYKIYLTELNENRQGKEFLGVGGKLKEMEQTLMRFQKNNILLIGKTGVGKSSLVEEFAKMLRNNHVLKELRDMRILELDLNKLLAGTKYRGDFESRIDSIFENIDYNEILFIDEIHSILKLGGAEGALPLGESIKPHLTRNDLRIIGATTEEEYIKTIKNNKALDRRFTKIYLEEPTLDDSMKMLELNKRVYEEHYNIRLNDLDFSNLKKIIKRKKGNLPDKAFDSLEDYCYTKKILNIS